MKKRWLMLAVGVGILALYIVLRGGGEESAQYETAPVIRDDVVHEVSVTGHLDPLDRIELAFSTAGRVAEVLVEEGAEVGYGTVLVRLEADREQAEYAQARAVLDRERAVLDDLMRPLRAEERAVKDASVRAAVTALASAETAARTTLRSVYVSADDAIKEKADELFNENRGDTPSFGVRFTYGGTEYVIRADSQTEVLLGDGRARTAEALEQIGRATSETNVALAIRSADENLEIIEQFLNALADTVNRYVPTDVGAQTVYEAYQASVGLARTAVVGARAELVLARQSVEAAEAQLVTATNSQALALSGASAEAIRAQYAAVRAAEHALERANATVKTTVLTAPFAGVISKLNVNMGETVSAYVPVGELVAPGGYELLAYIPEADISRVKLGDAATVTFDAFERTDVFSARVMRIALTETIREGVPTYKTTLTLIDPPQTLTLRPGFSADIDIRTDAREKTLSVPTRSIQTVGARTFVRVWTGSEVVERDVVTGLRGSSGVTEIVSGLTEGEEVILFYEPS